MTTDFEADLRAKMAGINPSLPSGLAQEVVQSHHRHQKSRRTTMAATGGAAAVVGVAAGLALTSSPAPVPVTTAYVVDHVTSALESSNTIGYSALRLNTGVQIDKWTYGAKARVVTKSANGQILEDTSDTTTVSAQKTVSSGPYVNYQDKFWRNTSASIVGEQQSTCDSNPTFSMEATSTLFSVDWTADIETALKCSPLATLTVLGHQQVDGKDTIELQEAQVGKAPHVLSPKTTVWVDPQTYLPVRMALYNSSDQLAATVTFSWLPPTNSNLADLITPVPSGFKHEQIAPDTMRLTPLAQALQQSDLGL